MVNVAAEAEIRVRVTQVRDVADRVREFVLQSVDGGDLPAWQPGAHVDLVLDSGLVRQYSLCGDASDRSQWRVAVLREQESRGGSEELHAAVTQGHGLAVRGPRNHFALVPAARYVFIAGGIGITPFLPMLEAATSAAVPWTLAYGGRRRTSMAYADDLVARYGDRVTLVPQDELGLIDLQGILAEPGEDALVYCCGPEPLLRAVESACGTWPDDALHLERFTPKEQGGSVGLDSFTVEAVASGVTVEVPAGTSILDTLEDAGVPVMSSCQEGTCGTCEVPVLEGLPEHRDSILTPAEQKTNETMFICVSRSLSAVLRLDV